MAKANLSSIDTTNGDKLAYYAKSREVSQKSPHKAKESKNDQVVNAKKLANLANAKKKARKKAKMVKASRKKNKR